MASTMPRTLGIGEYDGGQLVPMVRQSFLHTIRKSAPKVLEELRDEPLPLFLIAKREPVANIPRRTKREVEQLRKKIIEGTIESSDLVSVRRDFEDNEFNFGRTAFDFSSKPL